MIEIAQPVKRAGGCYMMAPKSNVCTGAFGTAKRRTPNGTSITEGTANFLVNRRMNKSKQMRWSRDGADLLLQVRCAVYNGTLGSGLGHRFDRIAKADPVLAQAA